MGFDLFLDGMSFFDFPKIFELGHPSSNKINGGNGIQTAAFSRSPDPHPHPSYSGEGDRWDTQSADYHHPSPFAASHSDNSVRSEPVAANFDFLSDPVTNVDHFGSSFASPPPPSIDEFAPRPLTAQDFSNQIMSAYEQPPASSGLLAIENSMPNALNQSTQLLSPSNPAGSPNSFHQTYSPTSTSTPPIHCNTPPRDSSMPTTTASSELCNEKLSMNTLHETDSSPQSVRQLSELEAAMQSLVNFDDINEPAESPVKLTMVKQEEKVKNPSKSKGLPPVNASWLGREAPLSEIKTHAAQRPTPSKEVMRTNAFDPSAQHAGMIVAYGTPTSNPPPIQNTYNAFGQAY